MREIKFRAWFPDEKKFIPFNIETIVDGFIKALRDRKCLIQQYTGLKDRHGKEIYEGDIVDRIDLLERKEMKYISKMTYKYKIEFKDGEFIGINRFTGRLIEPKEFIMFEIIGNIYENPNLLTKEGI